MLRVAPLLAVTALAALVAGLARSDEAPPYETPPDEEPGTSLSAAESAGNSFHIEAPVHSDGLMHHYVVVSQFGNFAAYGHDALLERLHEVAALDSIARTSDADVALASVGRALKANAGAVVDLAKNPVGAVTGIPRGVGHLFGGYRARAEELSADVQRHHGDSAAQQSGSSVVSRSGAQAKRYADSYLGVSKAEMRWYQKFDIDPYTRNQVLRDAMRHLAKVDAATTLGVRFVPVAGIPYAGEVDRALHTIYNEDPAVLRKRRREALSGYGLTAQEIQAFESSALLTPTRQTELVATAAALRDVAGRDELFRHALAVTSEEEVQVFLHSSALLLHFHQRTPVTRILTGVRLPAARLADGRIAVFGAFDAVYWTVPVAGYAQSLAQVLSADASGREAWLSGSVSARARVELEQRGWRVVDRAERVLAEGPADATASSSH